MWFWLLCLSSFNFGMVGRGGRNGVYLLVDLCPSYCAQATGLSEWRASRLAIKIGLGILEAVSCRPNANRRRTDRFATGGAGQTMLRAANTNALKRLGEPAGNAPLPDPPRPCKRAHTVRK